MLSYKIRILLSLPRSLYVCLLCLPFRQALKVPVIIANNVKIRGCLRKGFFEIRSSNASFGMIKIGIYDGSFDLGRNNPSLISFKPNSKIIFGGRCNLKRGIKIALSNNAQIFFGNRFHCNCNTIISSCTKISFGDYTTTGWNCTIVDGDGHDVCDYNTNKRINDPQEINIGKSCWLCSHSTIMKGVRLASEVIIPYGNVVTKSCAESYAIFGGIPNRVLKSNVYRADGAKKYEG